jgi:hypothetical protein
LANVLANGGIGFGPGANGSLFLMQTNFTPAQFVIASLKPRNVEVQLQSGRSPSTSAQWEMECFGPANSQLALETSSDMRHWRDAATLVEETAPGVYHVLVQETDAESAFFRLRLEAKTATPAE